MFEFDECLSICWLSCVLNDRGSVPIKVEKKFLLSNPSFLVVIPRLQFSPYLRSFLRWIIRRNLKLTAHLHLVPSQRMRGGISVLQSNQLRYLLYCSTETVWPAPVPVHIFRRFPSIPAVITHLKQSGNVMYLNFVYSNICWERPNEFLLPQQFVKLWIPKMNKRCLINLERYTEWKSGAQKNFHRKICIQYVLIDDMKTLLEFICQNAY